MTLRGAKTLLATQQKEIQGGCPTPRPSRCQPVPQIAFCQSDNECPSGQICCFGNCGIE